MSTSNNTTDDIFGEHGPVTDGQSAYRLARALYEKGVLSWDQAWPLVHERTGIMPVASPTVAQPTKPYTVPVNFDGIPERLRALPRWVLWAWIWNGKKWEKLPYRVNANPPFAPRQSCASNSDPAHWSSFDEIKRAYETRRDCFDGIGLALPADEFLVCDLDYAGAMPPWAMQIVHYFCGRTWIEQSPRGRAHIWLQSAPIGKPDKWVGDADNKLEMFDGSSARFIYITGQAVSETGETNDNRQLEITASPDEKEGLLSGYKLGGDFTSANAIERADGDGFVDDSDANKDRAIEYLKALGPVLEGKGATYNRTSFMTGRGSTIVAAAAMLYDFGISEPAAFELIKEHLDLQPRESDGEISKELHSGYNTARKNGAPGSKREKSPDEVFASSVPVATTAEVISAVNQSPPPYGSATDFAPTSDQVSSPLRERISESLKDSSAKRELERQFEELRKNNTSIDSEYLRSGFQVSANGVFIPGKPSKAESNPLIKISAPCFVCRDVVPVKGDDGAARGGVLLFVSEGEIQELPFFWSELHDEKKFAQHVMGRGLRVMPGASQSFCRYLAMFEQLSKTLAVSRTGWIKPDESNESPAFMLPNGTAIVSAKTEKTTPLVLMGRSISTNNSCHREGSLDDWLLHVYAPIASRSRVVYKVLLSMAAPLLALAPTVETGGEHDHGPSQHGKTIAMQIAASTVGRAEDPNRGNSYIRTWSATANAIEMTCAIHNDMPMFLDEMGKLDRKVDVGQLVYRMAGGKPRERLTANIELRESNPWRTVLLSTGEESVQSRAEDKTQGKVKTTYAGQLSRLVDREVSGLDYYFSGEDQAKAARIACSKYYGALFPAFIEWLCTQHSWGQLSEKVENAQQSAVQRIKSKYSSLKSIQSSSRVIERMALAEVAGVLLVESQLLREHLTVDVVRNAVDTAIGDWLPNANKLSDGARASDSLRGFILANQDARFKSWQDKDKEFPCYPGEKVHREIAGYIDEGGGIIYMLPDAIKDATGREPKMVARELKEQGWLLRLQSLPESLQSRVYIQKQRVGVYAIKMTFLSGEPSGWEDVMG